MPIKINILKFKLSQVYFQSFESYQVQCFFCRSSVLIYLSLYYLLIGSSWMAVGIIGSIVGSGWNHRFDVGSSTAVWQSPQMVNDDGYWAQTADGVL